MTDTITTPIYYTNGNPHLGHVYTTLAAEVLRRAYTLYGRRARVRTGVDEHGLKVQRKAESLGMSPQKYCDQIADQFLAVFEAFGIDTRDFYRTTSPRHKEQALKLFKALYDSGDIYRSSFSGWYAPSDEAYYAEDETEFRGDLRVASLTGSPVEWVEEACFNFRLSKYQDALLTWYRDFPEAIRPATRRNEVISFVERGLKDLCVTRKNFSWGIDLGDDFDHDILYVWVDALSNYLTPDKWGRQVWPAQLQLVGKDILRFHAVIWPALLMSAGLPLPTKIFAHGWWLTDSGDKMAKSTGNAIDPLDILKKYDDPGILTYYMFREVPFGEDGKFSSDGVHVRFRELANKYGNLVNRVCTMIRKYEIPIQDFVFSTSYEDMGKELLPLYDDLAFHKILDQTVALMDEANQYLALNTPWAQSCEASKRADILNSALADIWEITLRLQPYLPYQASHVIASMSASYHHGVALDIPILFTPPKDV